MDRLEELYAREEELQTDIDDAAENDDGEAWEALNDELEEVQEAIEVELDKRA